MVLPRGPKKASSEFQGLTLANESQEAAPGTVTVRETAKETERETKREATSDRWKDNEEEWMPGGLWGLGGVSPPTRSPPHHTEMTSGSLRAWGSLPSSTQKKPDVPLAPAVRTSSSEWASALGGAGVRPAPPTLPLPPFHEAPQYLRKPISSQLSPATLALEREEHSSRQVPSVSSNTVSRASTGLT